METSRKRGRSRQSKDKRRTQRGRRNGGNNIRSTTSNGCRGRSRPRHTNTEQNMTVTTRIVHAESLGPSLPPLVITYTNDQSVVAEWLKQHVLVETPQLICLGFDTESKPCFTKEAARASQGPDILQLAKADGNCLVIHLSRMERLKQLQREYQHENIHALLQPNDNPDEQDKEDSRLEGYIQLSQVLKSPHIAKVGVSIDDDALELHENHLLFTNCRLDLRSIEFDYNSNDGDERKLPAKSTTDQNGTKISHQENDNNRQPLSLKGLAEFHVQGLSLPKIKRLQMSNWAASLSDAQVGYAAADAFAGAMVVATLEAHPEQRHTRNSLIASVLAKEIDIAALREHREERKRERKKEQEKRRQEKRKQKNNKKAGQGTKNEAPTNDKATMGQGRPAGNASLKRGNGTNSNYNKRKRSKTHSDQGEGISLFYQKLETRLV